MKQLSLALMSLVLFSSSLFAQAQPEKKYDVAPVLTQELVAGVKPIVTQVSDEAASKFNVVITPNEISMPNWKEPVIHLHMEKNGTLTRTPYASGDQVHIKITDPLTNLFHFNAYASSLANPAVVAKLKDRSKPLRKGTYDANLAAGKDGYVDQLTLGDFPAFNESGSSYGLAGVDESSKDAKVGSNREALLILAFADGKEFSPSTAQKLGDALNVDGYDTGANASSAIWKIHPPGPDWCNKLKGFSTYGYRANWPCWLIDNAQDPNNNDIFSHLSYNNTITYALPANPANNVTVGLFRSYFGDGEPKPQIAVEVPRADFKPGTYLLLTSFGSDTLPFMVLGLVGK